MKNLTVQTLLTGRLNILQKSYIVTFYTHTHTHTHTHRERERPGAQKMTQKLSDDA